MDANDGAKAGRGTGLALVAAAFGVFIVCSLIQAAGGSSMFSASYADPDNFLLGLLMNVTFYPGWLLTGALTLGGLGLMVSGGETST